MAGETAFNGDRLRSLSTLKSGTSLRDFVPRTWALMPGDQSLHKDVWPESAFSSRCRQLLCHGLPELHPLQILTKGQKSSLPRERFLGRLQLDSWRSFPTMILALLLLWFSPDR